jgi:hypothetical protein
MVNDGYIEFTDSGNVLRPDLTEETFLKSSLAASSVDLVHNGEYRSYSAGRHSIAGTVFAVSIFFESGVLKSIHLSPVDEAVSKWEDVTDAVLKRHAHENDEWIRRECGTTSPASFSWGTVESTCDKRSLAASIIVVLQET